MRLDSRDSPVRANNIVQVSREFLLKFVLAETKKEVKNDKKKEAEKWKVKKKWIRSDSESTRIKKKETKYATVPKMHNAIIYYILYIIYIIF